jgi:hypothetical protein
MCILRPVAILLRPAFVDQQNQANRDQDDGMEQVEVFPPEDPVCDKDASPNPVYH